MPVEIMAARFGDNFFDINSNNHKTLKPIQIEKA